MGINLHVVFILLAVALFGVALYSYYRTTPPVTGRVRALLVGLRVAAFLLIVFLMMDPRYVYQSQKKEPPVVVALVDRSASMTLPVDTQGADAEAMRFDEARELSRAVERVVEGRGARFNEIFFSDDIVPAGGDSIAPDGQGTDIAQAMASAYKMYEGENLAGFVLLSDGAETEERLVRPSPPSVPVFTVGLGDTSAPEDIRIKEVDYNTIVRVPSRASIEAVIHYSGGSTKRFTLRLVENNRVLFEKDTLLTPQSREIVQRIPVEFREPGRRNFVLETDVDGFDAELENNRRDIVIDAEKGGVRLLIVDMLPGWEVHFLTEFLRYDETFDFDLVTSFTKRPALERAHLVEPADVARKLRDYDALIISSIEDGFLDPVTTRAIERFVREEGKGLLVLPGPSSLFEHAAAWNSLSDLLPVRGRPPHRFNLQYTSVRPGAQAELNPITAQLVPLLSQTEWQQRSPLLGYYAALTPKSNVEVLLETERRRAPAFIYQRTGKGRVAIVTAGPLWRWKFLAESNTLYDEMISRLLDVLSRGEDTERFTLTSRKNVYDSGESAVVYAEIFDEKMQPVTGVPVRVEVARVEEDGGEVPLEIVSMQREGSDNPRFKTTLPPLTPGKYRIRGETALPGRSITSQPVDITVSSVSVEYQKVNQDRPNLLRIARQSGGAYWNRSAVVTASNDIPLHERVTDTRAEMSLRTSLLVFSVLLGLLIVEWIIRKRTGMI